MRVPWLGCRVAVRMAVFVAVCQGAAPPPGLRIVKPCAGDGIVPVGPSRRLVVEVELSMKTADAAPHFRLCFELGGNILQCPPPSQVLWDHGRHSAAVGVSLHTDGSFESIRAVLLDNDDKELVSSDPVAVVILPVIALGPQQLLPLEPPLADDFAYKRKFLPIASPWEEARPSSRCVGGDEGVLLAVGIVSAAGAADRRQAVRDTWVSSLSRRFGDSVRHRFFLGIPRSSKTGELEVPSELLREIEEHGDITVMDHEDTYRSVYYRAVGIFRWGVEKCNADFVMRANDDIYLHLEPLVSHLRQWTPPFLLYMGFFIGDTAVCRLPPESEPGTGPGPGPKNLCFPISHYPAQNYITVFAQGNMVILSGDIAEEVGSISDQPWRPPVPDDVAVAMVAHGAGATLHDLQASWAPDERPVDCRSDVAAHFDLSVAVMRQMHANIEAGQDVCLGVLRWRQ